MNSENYVINELERQLLGCNETTIYKALLTFLPKKHENAYSVYNMT